MSILGLNLRHFVFLIACVGSSKWSPKELIEYLRDFPQQYLCCFRKKSMVWGFKIIGLMMLFSSWSWGATVMQKLETDYGKIFIPELKDWELGRDMYGMPFIYFSPQENSQRSNISFTYTGVEVKVNLAEMGQDPKGYQELKSNWAQSVEAKPLNYHAYKSWKNMHGHKVHEVGFEYLFKEKKYAEMSYYVDCRGQLVYAKSLRLLINDSHASLMHQLVRELDCGAK